MRKKSFVHFFLCAFLSTALLSGGFAGAFAAETAAATEPREVISFLNQTISWYRHLPSEQQLATEANEVFFLNDDRQLADQVVRLSFDFARAQARLIKRTASAEAQQGESPSLKSRYEELALKAEQHLKEAQQRLELAKQKLNGATGTKREILQSSLGKAQSEVELAEARRNAVRSLLEFTAGVSNSGDLHSQIDELERLVPRAASAATASTQPDTSAGAAVAASRKSESSGILALSSEVITIGRKMRVLDEALQQTDSLGQASRVLRKPLVTSLKELTRRGDDVASGEEASSAEVLTRQKQELDSLTAQYRQLSAAVLPLGKQGVLLDVYRQNLTGWRDSLRAQYSSRLRALIIRLVALALVLAAVGVVAHLWRRAVVRYVQEPGRQHQLLLVRRIALWLVVAIIVALAFATELGSLATFAGLLTAGVAFALQNVILSVAGYFFLIGKYGVRVGDRVQIAGVTGNVIDIGLVRLHLMEVGDGGSARPTGRVVVFSNSVVFQPNASFFKQVPGTRFVWHEIPLILTPDSDHHMVEERLLGAVERVFAEYKENIEQQRKQMERALSPLAINPLRPQSRLRLTQTGLEVVIRFPVELEKAAEVSDRVTRELLDAIAREPKLKLAASTITVSQGGESQQLTQRAAAK